MCKQAKLQGRGPFGDERFDYEPGDSDLPVVNWDLLSSVALAKFHVKKLYDKEKEGDDPIVYQLKSKCGDNYGDEANPSVVYRGADKHAAYASEKLLRRWAPRELLSKLDLDKFFFLIEKARHHFKFYDHLRQPSVIQHDSSVGSVIERLSLKWVKWFSYSDVEALVEDYISVLQEKQYTDLCYKYRLFLADNLSVKAESNLSSMLKELKESVCFSKEGFGSLSSSDIESGLEYYFPFLIRKKGDNKKTRYKERIHEIYTHEKSRCEKSLKRFPRQFSDPIHFLVFKEREEVYAIQHPLLEIVKLRAFFNQMVFGICCPGQADSQGSCG